MFVACGLHLSTQVWIAILIPLVVVFCWIRNLDSLAPLATVANICIIFGLSVILYDCFYLISERKAAVNTFGVDAVILGGTAIPVFFGNAVYAFEGIGVVKTHVTVKINHVAGYSILPWLLLLTEHGEFIKVYGSFKICNLQCDTKGAISLGPSHIHYFISISSLGCQEVLEGLGQKKNLGHARV